MSDVVLKNVSKVYEGGNTAVKDVNIEIKDKEFVVLVGPSGCGKSTTLRMVAGLEDISSGELWIDGKECNNTPPKDRDIAMVFQNYALYPHLTVRENMAFGLKLRKFPKPEIKTRVEAAAKILGLEDFLDRKPKALSGGQRQRVAVGRAIVRRPKVFLFDEPLSNLDAKLRVQMRTEISKLHRELQATVIYVTHDQVEAMTMGTKIVVMKDGIIQQIDSPLNLYQFPLNKFVAGFIGSPAMNFVSGSISFGEKLCFTSSNGAFKSNLGKEFIQPELLDNKNVWLGIRPENIFTENSNCIKDFAPITLSIEAVEQMGNEVFLYFSLDSSTFIARVPPKYYPLPGSSMTVYLDTRSIILFDAETELVIN